jgi:hypothetical protein
LEAVESLVRFIGSYPLWARLLILLCLIGAVGTLVLAPRTVESQLAKPPATATGSISTATPQQAFLRIKPIRLHPPDPNAEIQLSIFVNDTEYRHPSVGGVEWMKTGPAMSEKIIRLPSTPKFEYEVRFEMRVRSGGVYNAQSSYHMGSQMQMPVMTLPYSGEYSLYRTDNKTRSAGVGGVVPWELYLR